MIGNAKKLLCREPKKFGYKVCMQLWVAQDKATDQVLKILEELEW